MKREKIIIDATVFLDKSNSYAEKVRADFKKHTLSKEKKAILCTYGSELLRILRVKNSYEIYPVIPNMPKYIRDKDNYSLVELGIRKTIELGTSLLSIVPIVAKNAVKIRKGDVSSIIQIISNLELAQLKKFKPQVVFLHPQLTDLFLINDNYAPIKSFMEITKKYGMQAGLFTNHIAYTLEKLDEWKSDIKHICTPINPNGYLMKPNKKAAESAIMKTKREIYAYDPTCGDACSLKKAIKHAQNLNIRKLIISGQPLELIGNAVKEEIA